MTKKPQSAEDKKAQRSNAIEERILEAQKRKEERAFLEELAKRITVAREGKMRADRQEFPEALSSFRRFLAITARSISVEVNELSPHLIDEKQRSAESLLVSSILLDMLKILDKLDTESAREERRQCHKLFIRFTVGQSFQSFAAENLRKFITYRKTIRNRNEFWATYQAIKVKRFCVVATWAFQGDGAPEVARLRRYRDQHLHPHPLGRALVNLYYAKGEWLVWGLAKIPGAQKGTRRSLRWLLRHLPAAH